MGERRLVYNKSDRIRRMNVLRRSPLLRSGIYISAIAACLAAIYGLRLAEPDDATLRLHGVMDVSGHLLTALIAAIGVRALRLPVPIWSILLGGVVLDLGHGLGWLGYANALEGSSRNGSHSLFIVAVLACIGFADAPRAHIWLGIAMGATSHLWRDMGTGTVALMWPISDTVYGTLYSRYLAVLAGISLAMIGSATLLAVYDRARGEDRDRPQNVPSPGAYHRDG
jgi:membrane-bound metal-dependent hydrolase YbcI (DUF457 family)